MDPGQVRGGLGERTRGPPGRPGHQLINARRPARRLEQPAWCSAAASAGPRRLQTTTLPSSAGAGRQGSGDRSEVERGDPRDEAIERPVLIWFQVHEARFRCSDSTWRAKATLYARPEGDHLARRVDSAGAQDLELAEHRRGAFSVARQGKPEGQPRAGIRKAERRRTTGGPPVAGPRGTPQAAIAATRPRPSRLPEPPRRAGVPVAAERGHALAGPHMTGRPRSSWSARPCCPAVLDLGWRRRGPRCRMIYWRTRSLYGGGTWSRHPWPLRR